MRVLGQPGRNLEVLSRWGAEPNDRTRRSRITSATIAGQRLRAEVPEHWPLELKHESRYVASSSSGYSADAEIAVCREAKRRQCPCRGVTDGPQVPKVYSVSSHADFERF